MPATPLNTPQVHSSFGGVDQTLGNFGKPTQHTHRSIGPCWNKIYNHNAHNTTTQQLPGHSNGAQRRFPLQMSPPATLVRISSVCEVVTHRGRFGTTQFVIISHQLDSPIDASEATQLLSSVALAFSHFPSTNLPVFIPVGDIWTASYIGLLTTPDEFTFRFDADCLDRTPTTLSSLKHLLDYFEEKLVGRLLWPS